MERLFEFQGRKFQGRKFQGRKFQGRKFQGRKTILSSTLLLRLRVQGYDGCQSDMSLFKMEGQIK